jgi:hypothetical protein
MGRQGLDAIPAGDLQPKRWSTRAEKNLGRIWSSFWRNDHEEIAIYGRADCVCLTAGVVGSVGGGSLSQARRQPADVLPLEEEVRGNGCRRTPSTEVPVGRKQTTEVAGG